MKPTMGSGGEAGPAADEVTVLEALFGVAGSAVPARRPGRGFAQLLGVLVAVAAMLVSFVVVPAMALTRSVEGVQDWWSAQAIELDPAQALPQPSVLLDANGDEFARLYSQNRIPVRFTQISSYAIDAAVATEDATFWSNGGINLSGLGRAVATNVLSEKSDVIGGSGITQQYVKNLLLTRASTEEEIAAATEKSMHRKLVEAATAMELTTKMSKKDIITGYLNVAYFGNQAYGIGAAAKEYFSTTASDLTLGQASLLIGMIRSPDDYDPYTRLEAATQRRSHVLDRMVAEGYITRAQADAADLEDVVLKPANPDQGCAVSPYPFYCEWVRLSLLEDPSFGASQTARENRLYGGGLRISTALNPQAQQAADAAAHAALPSDADPANGIAVVEPGTGKVVALSTNRGFGSGPGQTEIILPATGMFQIGSTFKVVTAAAALEQGWNVDTSFTAPSEVMGYHNNANAPGGTLTLGEAINESMNTWFVMLQQKIGTQQVARTAVSMGMTSLPLDADGLIDENATNLTIGVFEATPLQLAQVYATVAAHGVSCTPLTITKIADTAGRALVEHAPDCHQAIRASTADTLANLLMDNVARGTGTRAQISDGRPTAGKTGTTDNSGAVWFAGFVPQFAAAVWFGDPRGAYDHPLTTLDAFGQTWSPVYGSGAPALTWHTAMDGITAGLPVQGFESPGGDSYVGLAAITPDLRGLTEQNARAVAAAQQLELTVLRDVTSSSLGAGRVAGQEPTPGSALPATGKVTVHISH